MYRTGFKSVSLTKKLKWIGIGFADSFQCWQNHMYVCRNLDIDLFIYIDLYALT